jgi:WD40 repeat protein
MSQEGTGSVAERLRAFFFGRDVFISYSYADSAYAEALAVALQERKFSVFLGAWGASPGEELSRAVSSAARQSRMLVVIATPRSRASGPVDEEIGYFAGHHRPVVPVDVGLGIRDTRTDWPALAGTDVIHEPAPLDPHQPLPSECVLARITNAAKFTRQTTRLARFVAAVFVVAVALIAAAAGAAAWSRAVVREAQARAGQAEERERTARGNTIGAQVLASAAGLRAFDTALRSGGVEQQARLAEDNRRVAAALTEREASIGSSIRMANEAAALLEMEPARLPSAALLAVQSVRFLHKRGTRALAADAIIRETLRLLPPISEHVRFRIGHPLEVVAVTPDARWLLLAKENGREVIDTDSGEHRLLLPPAGTTISGGAVSDDGSTVAAVGEVRVTDMPGDDIKTIVVWRKAESEPRSFVAGFSVHDETVSGDGRFVAYRSDSRIVVLSVAEATMAFLDSPGNVESMRFSRSGDVLAISGHPAMVWAWRAGQQPVAISSSAGTVVLSPADESIVAAVLDRSLSIRNWKDGSVVPMEPITVGDDFRELTFSSDGSTIVLRTFTDVHVVRWTAPASTFSFPARMATAVVPTSYGAAIVTGGGTVEFVSRSTRGLIGRTVHDGSVLTIAARSDGSVRSVSTTGAMTSWPVTSEWPVPGAGVLGIPAIAPDGDTIAIAERQWYDRPRSLAIHGRNGLLLNVPSLDFHPTAIAIGFDGALFAGSAHGAVLRWSSTGDAGATPTRLAQAPEPVTAIAVGRGGRVAWAAGNQVWVRGSAGPLATTSPITTLAFGTDGQLAAGTKEGKVVLWDHGTVATFTRQHPIESLAISADGRYIAATAHPQSAVVWPVAQPGIAYELPGDPATAVAFHPTDGTIVSGGQNGVVHVWSDWRKQRALEVARFSGGWYLRAARFSEDGRYLVTVPKYGHGAKRLWKSEDLIAVACRRLEPLRPSGELAAYDIVCGAD